MRDQTKTRHQINETPDKNKTSDEKKINTRQKNSTNYITNEIQLKSNTMQLSLI